MDKLNPYVNAGFCEYVMTIARRGLKVKVQQGQGHGQANAVGPTLMEINVF